MATILDAYDLSDGDTVSSEVTTPGSVRFHYRVASATSSSQVIRIAFKVKDGNGYVPFLDDLGREVFKNVKGNTEGSINLKNVNSASLKCYVTCFGDCTGSLSIDTYSLDELGELQDIEADIETLQNKQFPNVGIHVLTGTSAATAGTYTGFQVLEDAVIDAITLTESAKVTGTNDFSGITLPAGIFIEIPGGFSTITLSAGSMILIKGS
jgi:hypothetical protein